MKSSFFSLTSLIAMMAMAWIAPSEAQQYSYGYPYFMPTNSYNYFRSGLPQPSYDFPTGNGQEIDTQGRFFFTTLKVTLATSTSTTTVTTTTVCTTSTSALKSCTPSGRRRRGMSTGNKEGYGLFYDDQEEEGEDGNIFLPSPKKESTPEIRQELVELDRVARDTPSVPFVVQPGFQPPKETGNARFLLSFATKTTTFTTTSTLISSLTATCKSTTAFQTCGSTGK